MIEWISWTCEPSRRGIGRRCSRACGKTGRCLIVHEDTLTAGFGAEIAAVVASEAFWWLDAPVERMAVEDVPMPYHEVLLAAVLPNAERIGAAIERRHHYSRI